MHVKNLPTLVESYKTYDDVHIVKSNDIGQVGLVMVIVMVMLFGPRVSLRRKVVSKFLLRLETCVWHCRRLQQVSWWQKAYWLRCA